jgi:hypothetical protein
MEIWYKNLNLKLESLQSKKQGFLPKNILTKELIGMIKERNLIKDYIRIILAK